MRSILLKTKHSEKLIIQKCLKNDEYKDIVRIPEAHRKGVDNKPIEDGNVCLITINNLNTYAIVRGLNEVNSKVMKIDEKLRKKLSLEVDKEYDIYMKKANFLEKFVFTWNSTDQSYRIVARMGLISIIAGVISIIMGVISIILTIIQ